MTCSSRKDAKSLTQTYTTNISLVATLIETITFAATFTLPGGYNNDAGSKGFPIMSKNYALQAFLISDILAMCFLFAVSFRCIIARWEDYEFLPYYRSFSKKLMLFIRPFQLVYTRCLLHTHPLAGHCNLRYGGFVAHSHEVAGRMACLVAQI